MGERRVAVAMSGGVDSSVAAMLLHRDGRALVGISLQLHDRGEGSPERFGRCCSPRDFLDARQVAEQLGFPFYVLNLEEEFRRAVLDDFVREYAEGRTPVPCAHCNSSVKFGDLLRRARLLGCDAVATGHYARVWIDPATGRPRLLRGLDRDKDQSYFLFGLTREQLERAIFPVGELTKTEVRSLAADAGLSVAGKPESQDICFVSEGGGYGDFLERELEGGVLAGEIVDREGRVLGTHEGIHRFTVGQRKGLGLAGPTPWYVVEIRARERRVVVGSESDQYRSEFRVSRVNWIAGDPPARAEEATVQVRHRHAGAEALLDPAGHGELRVLLRAPQRAVTPGQAAVFYRGDEVLGGGFIESFH
jgi:tRNA-uridine 2-sulfurtransferase